MESIFLSMGSRYSLTRAISHLLQSGTETSCDTLRVYLTKRYAGHDTVLTYKARHAIRYALRISRLPKGSKIAITAFTCIAVYQAVTDEGYIPLLVDCDPDTMQMGLSQLQKAYAQHPDLRGIIIQHTLGYAADYASIDIWRKMHKLYLIEDIAHSIGAYEKNGREVGTRGDMTVLSFSQDKVIDAVAGGALIIRKNTKNTQLPQMNTVSFGERLRNRIYPLMMWKIRMSFHIGIIGKLIHRCLRGCGVLSSPLSSGGRGIYTMPHSTAEEVYAAFLVLDTSLQHRRMIADIYRRSIDPSLIVPIARENTRSAELRFPLVVDRRSGLLAYLSQCGISIRDIWYDAPIAPKRLSREISIPYDTIPNALVLTKTIINLPTHEGITPQKAEFIAERIMTWHRLP